MKRLLLPLIMMLTLFAGNAWSLPMLMVRSVQGAEATMETLQQALSDYGYAIAHEQRCDGGLSEFDYKTDYYHVVFFGKIQEVRNMTEKHPELIPYLPLKIAVFAEDKETIVAAINPLDLSEFFDDPAVHVQLQRWSSDISAIFEEIRLSK